MASMVYFSYLSLSCYQCIDQLLCTKCKCGFMIFPKLPHSGKRSILKVFFFFFYFNCHGAGGIYIIPHFMFSKWLAYMLRCSLLFVLESKGVSLFTVWAQETERLHCPSSSQQRLHARMAQMFPNEGYCAWRCVGLGNNARLVSDINCTREHKHPSLSLPPVHFGLASLYGYGCGGRRLPLISETVKFSTVNS